MDFAIVRHRALLDFPARPFASLDVAVVRHRATLDVPARFLASLCVVDGVLFHPAKTLSSSSSATREKTRLWFQA